MAKPPSDPSSPPALNLPFTIDPMKDRYVIKGGGGVLVAQVKKSNGEVVTAHMRANGALQQMSQFDPSALSVSERRQLEHQLHKEGYTQTEISGLVGVTQQTVAHDLKIIRNQADRTISLTK